MSNQTLNLTPEVYQYFQQHAGRETDILAQLRIKTLRQYADMAQMQISPEQGQFMQFLVKALAAQKVLELGTFTGYSALWMALALPAEGRLVTCDIDEETAAVAQDFWRQAAVADKIEFKLGPAADTLQELLNKGAANSFDFAFIDADKTAYDVYYEQCLRLIRPGGIIALDNTLQAGRVADPTNQNPNTVAICQLNDKLLQDKRVLISMLPLSDGLTLVYKY